MDTLTNKYYNTYDYTNRNTVTPCYYDTLKQRYMAGIGAPMLRDGDWVAHDIEPGDNLDYLALKYYNNPTLWWIIAYFNNINDAFEPLKLKFTTIKIPNMSSITFEDFR